MATKDDSSAWVPVCSDCRTETITAIAGQHRCFNCDRLWDGAERAQPDLFATRPMPVAESIDVVMDILSMFWEREQVENHGNQGKSR